jgi:uncharacterized HAD superfamily protein
MSKRVSFAFDFDGVVTNPHEIKSQELIRIGYNVPPKHTERLYCVEKLGVPLEIYERAAYKANIVRLLEVPLEKGAHDVLARLARRNVSLVIVTSRTQPEVESLHTYLKINEIEVDHVINTDRRSKLEAIRTISPIMYVDDSPSKLKDLLQLKGSCSLFLYRNVANNHWVSDDGQYEWLQGNWTDIELHFTRLADMLTKKG